MQEPPNGLSHSLKTITAHVLIVSLLVVICYRVDGRVIRNLGGGRRYLT